MISDSSVDLAKASKPRTSSASRANDDPVTDGNGFCARVQRAFGRRDTALLLRAYTCAVEHSEPDADDHLRAAHILLDQRADAIAVTAALLAQPHRRGDLAASEIESRFGEEMSSLVQRAASDGLLQADTEAQPSHDLRRWLTSLSVDVRTVVLRIGLRLGALEELAERHQDGDQDRDQKDLARETLDLYVPLADRMGMGSLRTRLEDVCFRLLQPAVHAEMARSIEPIREEDWICLSLLKDGVGQLLEERGIDAAIEGRAKGLYSIYRKMRRLDSSLDDVMDRIGLRIIVPSVEACYGVLGLLHTRFRPVPGTFDDYIGLPKENGYRSLHTCVYPVPDISVKPVEFQIRTEAMHREAEYGVAAHWLYKDQAEAEAEDQRQLEWLRELLPNGKETFDHAAFVEHLHRQVYDDRPTGSRRAPSSVRPDLAEGERGEAL